MTGGETWISKLITQGSLVAVMEGSYIRELFPKLCSAAFVLECSADHGRIIGSFFESLHVANAYRGKLLGLTAIHLILLSINKIHCNLSGSVEIVSDCLGALNRVTFLPPYRILSRCWHSDILKNILVHCRDLTFTTYYLHVKAHQDDNVSFDKLSQKAQLNCICNHTAKQRIMMDRTEGAIPGQMFPLEPIGLFVRGKKMTSNTGGQICFWAKHQLARTFYNNWKILCHEQFDSVDWTSIHCTLHNLPRLFQVWAAKHVLSIAGTMSFLSHQDEQSPLCPSCLNCRKTCKHVAKCPEVGHAQAFSQSASELELWLTKNNAHPNLRSLLLRYLQGRGALSCYKCATALNLPHIFQEFSQSQDVIGWDNFVMGMVSSKPLPIQSDFFLHSKSSSCATRWISGLITQLLQVTQTQWIYQCILVHDCTIGM